MPVRLKYIIHKMSVIFALIGCLKILSIVTLIFYRKVSTATDWIYDSQCTYNKFHSILITETSQTIIENGLFDALLGLAAQLK